MLKYVCKEVEKIKIYREKKGGLRRGEKVKDVK